MSQRTLQGEIAGYRVLDMTFGLGGMQNEVKVWADLNLDLSAYRKINLKGSFQTLPIREGSLRTVLFDPPHVLDQRNTLLGSVNPIGGLGPVLATWKYGCYRTVDQLRKALYQGSREAYRVLEDGGTLIFKWSDAEKSFNWAVASIDKRFDTERIHIQKSGAGTGRHVYYVWYRKR